jgi:glycosyltransferase involved in cell wall biosynthesis
MIDRMNLSDRSSVSPLVAIVTPVYNGATFLDATMACVQAQTYANLVHVILDNASTDATPEILEKFQHQRVPLLIRRNTTTLPLHDNWEAAIRLCPKEAKYFLVLCADDLIEPCAIEKMVALAQRNESIGVVGCRWTTGRDPAGDLEHRRCGLPSGVSIYNGRWFIKSYLMQLHYATSPQYQLFRRDMIDDKMPFYPDLKMLMDVGACLTACLSADYGFVHSELGFTRIHSERVTDKHMAPSKMYDADWLYLIDKFGPATMTSDEFSRCRNAYLLHYFRRLLVWRYRDRNKAVFDFHLALLEKHGVRPTAFDYFNSICDWLRFAALNRRDEVGTARSLWPRTWSELGIAPFKNRL